MDSVPPWPDSPDSSRWEKLCPPGTDLLVTERWHGLLWMAAPHRVVSHTHDLLVTALLPGAVSLHATNRHLDYASGMSRAQRKLAAMATRRTQLRPHRETWTSLHVFTPGQWAHVWFSWDEVGAPVGYYVNFESPAVLNDNVLAAKDLVLDALVQGERWIWKDEEDFAQAERMALFPADTRAHLEDAARQLRQHLDRRAGPFDPTLLGRCPTGEPPSLPRHLIAEAEAAP